MGTELPVWVQAPKPELPAHLRTAQSIIHNAHAIRGTSIKPLRPPKNPDIQLETLLDSRAFSNVRVQLANSRNRTFA